MLSSSQKIYSELTYKLKKRNIKVGIVGLGYVGLPLAKAFSLKKIKTIGFDIDRKKIFKLRRGISYIKYFSNSLVKKMNSNGYLHH